MESLQILDYTVTNNELNTFEANISCIYHGNRLDILIKCPWNRESIYHHTVQILSSVNFNEEQKILFRKAISAYFKEHLRS